MGSAPESPVEQRRHEACDGGSHQALGRAVDILEFLADRGEATVGEVAAEIGAHRSTAFRLLGALEERHLVEQANDRRSYRVGFGVVRLATAVIDRLDVTRTGRPICRRLAAEVGETVNVAMLYSHHALNLYQAVGHARITIHNWVGHLTPLHCTSTGKVLLAHLPSERRQRLLAEAGLPALTPHTLTSDAMLAADLQATAARGYALAIEEYEVGLHAMAAPILGRDGVVAAAASVSGPAYRLGAERMRRMVPTLLGATTEISRLLADGSPG